MKRTWLDRWRKRVGGRLKLTDRQRIAALTALVNDRSQPNLNALSALLRNVDLLSLNVKPMGYELARQMAAALPVRSDTSARHVGLSSKPSTQDDMETDWLAHWCGELQIPFFYHRKLWELAYILQAVHDSGNLRPGARGLGFGCGSEPFASYFASRDVAVTITDLPAEHVRARGWSDGNQHAAEIEVAYRANLVDRARFDAGVRFRAVDMTAIPEDLVGYDFCWSMCAFEHLGSIDRGLAFVEQSLRTLRPGGTAVHTTEFNVNPDGPTIDNWPTVLFQQHHIETLAARLRAGGHHVAPLDFDTGDKPLDRFIDLPPWHENTMGALSDRLGQPNHLKLGIYGFVSTCFGLIVTKAS